MARIHYGVTGEGRGHAVRVRTMTEALRARHQVVIHAGADAYDFLEPLYRGSSVSVRRIPSMRWEHHDNGRISGTRTAWQGMRFLGGLPGEVRRLAEQMQREAVDLVITDFEPLTARAAQRTGIPFLSLDHQHFLRENDLSSLPWALRARARLSGWGIRALYGRQYATIVSSFYAPGIRPSERRVYQVRSLIRDELRQRQPQDHGYLLAYLRRSTPWTVLEALRDCGREVRIYGRGSAPAEANLQFREIHEAGFLNDLTHCSGVVCAAGNQLLGEALYLGKPVLALPEEGSDEQRINAHFLERSGRGIWRPPGQLDPADVAGFLACIHRYQGGEERLAYDGTRAAVDAIERCLADLGLNNFTRNNAAG